MSLYDNLQTLRSELDTALAAGDDATALTKARRIKGILAAEPDSVQGATGNRLIFDRVAIDTLVKDLERKLAFGQGIRTTLVTYKETAS